MATKYIVQAHEDGKWKAIYRGDDPAKVQNTYHEACGYVGEDNVRALKSDGVKEDGTARWVAIVVPEPRSRDGRGLYSMLVDGLHGFWGRRGFKVSRNEIKFIYMPVYLTLFVGIPLALIALWMFDPHPSADMEPAPSVHSPQTVVSEAKAASPASTAPIPQKLKEIEPSTQKTAGSANSVNVRPPADLAFIEGGWARNCLAAVALKADITIYRWDGVGRKFTMTNYSYLDSGEVMKTGSDVILKLDGDILVETLPPDSGAASFETTYKVINKNSPEYFNLNSANPQAAPALELLEMRVNGNVLPRDEFDKYVRFDRCLPK